MSLVRETRLLVSMFVDRDAEDTDAAATVAAILKDNGEPVQSVEPVPDGAPGVLAGAPMWAKQYAAIMAEVATARRAATVAYAEAYLAAEGTQQARSATADLAAAGHVETHETLAGRAEAFRMVLEHQARTSPEGGAQ